jgi:hypothetical protein
MDSPASPGVKLSLLRMAKMAAKRVMKLPMFSILVPSQRLQTQFRYSDLLLVSTRFFDLRDQKRFSKLTLCYPILKTVSHLGASESRGHIFSRVRPFYEQAVSDLEP